MGVDAIRCTHWAEGSKGTIALAEKVVEIVESGSAAFKPLYPDSMSLWDKVGTIATQIYDAAEVVADKSVLDQFKVFEVAGYGHFPICMAKTQYSFSTDPAAKGAPSGHTIAIREIRLSAGAEFIVVVTGDIMTMPGLPKVPAANSIKLVNGEVVGLF